MEPKTGYARLGGQHIAFEVMGDGPIDLVATSGRANSMASDWADPEAAAVLQRVASFCRLIRYDSLGTGSSDPVPLDTLPPLEFSLEEMASVMDAAGSDRAVLMGHGPGGHTSMLAAATRPERVLGLILVHAPARFLWAEGYEDGVSSEVAESLAKTAQEDVDQLMDIGNPSRANDPAYTRRRERYVRAVGGPNAWRAFMLEFMNADVRSLLPAIHVPTLVVHKQDVFIPAALGRHVAEAISGARLIILPGADAAPYWESPELFIDVVSDFVSTFAPTAVPSTSAARVMATILFTDIVSSTEQARVRGDSEWVHLLDLHDSLSRQVVEGQLGTLIKTTGDGIMARFDTPGRGILSAMALEHELSRVGLLIRAGLHTGEVELRGEDISGVGVHIAARVMDAAGPGEVLVSRTVKDLVFGSQFHFEDRGTHHLKGVEGDWQLFALTT